MDDDLRETNKALMKMVVELNALLMAYKSNHPMIQQTVVRQALEHTDMDTVESPKHGFMEARALR